ncbi:MAG: lytic transglycosylase domain-containing protein [Sulfurovum sp.]|nr:MAG: lytic transglycosylase domain-containing protein [Sulfurovum sp.]
MRRIVWMLILAGTLTAYAKMHTFEEVHRMPTSIEKDYYIWRLLSQRNTTAAQARTLIGEACHLNKKLRTAYRKKTGYNPPTIKDRSPATPDHIWKRRSRANKYFKTGLALLRQGKKEQAAVYLDAAYKNYLKRYEKDKSLFWLYLTTKKKIYLDQLLKSYDPNIYTLMAADTVKGRYPKTITYQIKKQHAENFDSTDPICWAKVKSQINHSDDLDALANHYAAQECIGIHTYIKAKACKHTKAYFPMPYRDIMRKLPKKRQALIYAIARQESRFVPAAVSRSFALGMMQFMPFLIDHVAKQKGEKIDYDAIFNPKKAIEYANYHLDYLSKHLYHPLFIAYAYNAGIGFTRKYLRNPKHFRKGPYEPYMSMETMENAQAREYGKKVLANYVIYLNKLGIPTRIFSLMKILATPEKTDSFRR